MISFRFSLRHLILAVSVVGLFLGISHARRREIHATAQKLHQEGYQLAVANRWRDVLWQRKPIVGTLYQNGKDEYLEVSIAERKAPKLVHYSVRQIRGPEIERLKSLGMVQYP
jgi:hypothetical protein